MNRPIKTREDQFAELLSQDLDRDAIGAAMGWTHPGSFNAALQRLRVKLGSQAV